MAEENLEKWPFSMKTNKDFRNLKTKNVSTTKIPIDRDLASLKRNQRDGKIK